MLLSLQKYIDVIIRRDHNVIYILYKIYYYIYIYKTGQWTGQFALSQFYFRH